MNATQRITQGKSRHMPCTLPSRVAVAGGRSGARRGRGQLHVVASAPRLTILSSVSRVVELQGLTTKYEVLAGRSAMIGTITALVVEAVTEQSLLKYALDTSGFLTLSGGVVAVAALCATLRSTSNASPALLEPVITSLTAVKRSGSSITALNDNVDKAVDDLLMSTFTPERLRDLTDFASEVQSDM